VHAKAHELLHLSRVRFNLARGCFNLTRGCFNLARFVLIYQVFLLIYQGSDIHTLTILHELINHLRCISGIPDLL
jgi:hypothetical protein